MSKAHENYFGVPGASFFNKKRLETVPQGHQNSATLQEGTISNLFWKTVPFSLRGHYFRAPLALLLHRKCMENSALLESGNKMVPQKVPFYGRSIGAQGHHFGAVRFEGKK